MSAKVAIGPVRSDGEHQEALEIPLELLVG